MRTVSPLRAAAVAFGLAVFAQSLVMAEPAVMPPDMKAVVDRAIEKFRSIGTISYTERSRYLIRREGVAEPEVLVDESRRLLFVRGKGLKVEAGPLAAFTGGWIVRVRDSKLGQYVEASLKDRTEFSTVVAQLSLNRLHPPEASEALLDPDGTLKRAAATALAFGSARPEERAGVPGVWISAKTPGEGRGPVPIEIWCRDADGMPMLVRYDWTEQQRERDDMEAEMEGGEKPAKLLWAGYEMEVADLRINEPIDESLVTFMPAPGEKKLDAFEPPAPPSETDQLALINKEAPAFTGKDLDGKAVSLAEFRGKVVVIDFWATWCGPCVGALPEFWKVVQAFKDKPVVFLGLNHDRPGSNEKVRSFLEKRGFAIRQVLDHDNAIGEAYKVFAIPCMVIIDAKGIVQDIHVGAGGDMAAELTGRLDRVLRGESLHSADELAAKTKDAAAGNERRPSRAARQKLDIEETSPERLSPEKSVSSMVGHVMRPVSGEKIMLDLDMNGVPEMAYADAAGRLMIVSEDGRSTRRFQLEGSGPTTQFGAVESARVGDLVQVLIAWSNRSGKSVLHLGAFTPDAEPVWSYDYPIPAGALAYCDLGAGDLDADGTTEYLALIGLSMFEGGDRSAPKNGVCLLVLDAKGALLSARKIDADFSGFVHVAAPEEPGKPPVILLQTDQEIRRFTYTPKGGAVEEQK